jgi:phosphatidylglycerophosphatase C
LSIQVLYDFDGTITSKDTSILLMLELLKLRPWRFIRLILFLFKMFIANNSTSKQRHKNVAIGYLIKNLNDIHLNKAMLRFKNKVKFLYRPSVLATIDEAIQDDCTVLIVTASPSFAISACMSDLPVIVLGTEFEKKVNIYTGLLKSENCYGQEKVNRINEWATLNNIPLKVESAWGDHFSDFDMLSLSAKRYWVGGKQLREQVMECDTDAHFLNIDH